MPGLHCLESGRAPAFPSQMSWVQGLPSSVQMIPIGVKQVPSALQWSAHSAPPSHGSTSEAWHTPSAVQESGPLQTSPSVHGVFAGSEVLQSPAGSLHVSLQSPSPSGPGQGVVSPPTHAAFGGAAIDRRAEGAVVAHGLRRLELAGHAATARRTRRTVVACLAASRMPLPQAPVSGAHINTLPLFSPATKTRPAGSMATPRARLSGVSVPFWMIVLGHIGTARLRIEPHDLVAVLEGDVDMAAGVHGDLPRTFPLLFGRRLVVDVALEDLALGVGGGHLDHVVGLVSRDVEVAVAVDGHAEGPADRVGIFGPTAVEDDRLAAVRRDAEYLARGLGGHEDVAVLVDGDAARPVDAVVRTE